MIFTLLLLALILVLGILLWYTKRRLTIVEQSKTVFLSKASHQLRTPLTAIKGYASLALEGHYGKLTKKLERVFINITEANERLIRLTHDLLLISRAESGKLTIDRELVDLTMLVRDLGEEFKVQAQKKDLMLVLSLPSQKVEYAVDREKFKRALSILLRNAVQYTEQGTLTLSLIALPDKIEVLVADTGPGLSKREQSVVFESFLRGDAGLATFPEGTGVNLRLAKLIIQAHEGRLTASSHGKGRGSVFTIALPRALKEGITQGQ